MTLIVNCTKCGKELRSQDRYAGKPVRCSQCGTINRLPSAPSATPPPMLESAFCFVCGKDFSVDRDLVRDKKGRSYHRRCYEEASRYEKSRREQETRSRHSGLPAHITPESIPRQATPAEPIDDELVELMELVPPSEESWPDLSQTGTSSLDGPAIGGFGRRDGVWLYVLIGFGAAVPIVVLLFIIVQLIISSIQGPSLPARRNGPNAGQQPPSQESSLAPGEESAVPLAADSPRSAESPSAVSRPPIGNPAAPASLQPKAPAGGGHVPVEKRPAAETRTDVFPIRGNILSQMRRIVS